MIAKDIDVDHSSAVLLSVDEECRSSGLREKNDYR